MIKKFKSILRFLRGRQLGLTLPIAILIVVVLVIAGGVGYYFYKTSEVPKIEEVKEELGREIEKEELEEEKVGEEIFCKDSLDCPAQMKCENSICVDVGCIKEGQGVLAVATSPEGFESLEHMATECCEGLKEIHRSEEFDENCNLRLSAVGIIGGRTVCSNCGNGICEEWETKCNCPEDCLKEAELRDIQRVTDLMGTLRRGALEFYFDDHASYPVLNDTSEDGEFLKVLIDGGYLAEMLLDPLHPKYFYEYQGTQNSYTLKCHCEIEGGYCDMVDNVKDYTLITFPK